MSAMPDSVTLDEREYQNEMSDYDAVEPEAIARVQEAFMRNLTWERVLDELGSMPTAKEDDVLAALRYPDFAEVGAIIYEMVWERWIKNDGLKEVEKMVNLIIQEQRGY